MNDFPGFGNKPKEEQKQPETRPVVIEQQNESELKKIFKEFISDDVKDIKKNLISRVIIPSTQKLVVDIVNNSVNWLFFGIKGNTVNRVNTPYQMMSGTSRVYTPYQNASTQNRQPVNNNASTGAFTFTSYPFDTRGEAEVVLAGLQDIIYQGKLARLSNYKILARRQKELSNTDENWGWRNLDNVGVELLGDGYYYIKFPNVEDLTR